MKMSLTILSNAPESRTFTYFATTSSWKFSTREQPDLLIRNDSQRQRKDGERKRRGVGIAGFALEATVSSSRGYHHRFRVTESEQVRVKSSIYLGRRLLTCPADVRSRGKKSVPLEHCASEKKRREREKEEDSGRGKRGFRRTGRQRVGV